jgi:type VI secretion system secreted protein Hcp
MAFDAFLKFDGIEGESQDKVHTGEIEIDSFSWGVSNPTNVNSGGGGGAGKASLSDFSFQSATSKASPNLMLACATGRHFPTATITCRKAGGPSQVEFLKIKLSDVLVSSYELGGNATDGNRNPEDGYSLAFVKIDFLYTVPRTGETVETVFDSRNVVGA